MGSWVVKHHILVKDASRSLAALFDASGELKSHLEKPSLMILHARAQVRGAALVCISIISTLVVLAVTRRKPVQPSDDMASVDMRPPVKARHSDLVA